MRIALATAEHLPDLSPDDQVLYEILQQRGVDVAAVVWDEQADWSSYDAVVTRSIWDYHLKYDGYLAWLDALDRTRIKVYNPTALQRWNADKHYMIDLAERGVRITPTIAVSRAESRTLSNVVAEPGWQRVVVKPAVASTGYETWLFDAPATDAHEKQFAGQLARMDLLVQQFAPGVSQGEMSFVFLGGDYSHAVLKRAAGDEFRIHVEHGGTVESYHGKPDEIAWAKSVVAALKDEPWSYARVDAVRDEAGLMLMELELLDPELFFLYNRAAAEKFADLITR